MYCRKVIGARFIGSAYAAAYNTTLKDVIRTEGCGGDYFSPRDSLGHGSHTAAIAAGSVSKSSLVTSSSKSKGSVNFGPASGVAYESRLAIYKVIWCGGYGLTADVAKAIDLAVSDGVDVISLSLGKLWLKIIA